MGKSYGSLVWELLGCLLSALGFLLGRSSDALGGHDGRLEAQKAKMLIGNPGIWAQLPKGERAAAVINPSLKGLRRGISGSDCYLVCDLHTLRLSTSADYTHMFVCIQCICVHMYSSMCV